LERGNSGAAYLIFSSAADSSDGRPLGFSLRTNTLAFRIATDLSISAAGSWMSILPTLAPALARWRSLVLSQSVGSAAIAVNASAFTSFLSALSHFDCE